MSQDEVELRDLIIDKLTSCGKIADLKAQIRAAVLITLSKEQKSKLPTIAHKERMKNVAEMVEGKLALSLIKDFMETFNLKSTLSVFELETGLNELELLSRDSINQGYSHLNVENKAEDPLLYNFIKASMVPQIEHIDKEIIRGSSKSHSGSSSMSPKSHRKLPQVSDPIEFKSEGSSEFSDVIGLLDTPLKKNAEGDKPVISPYQAPQKRASAGSGGDDHYDDSFSDKSDNTKQNQSEIEESINEIDVEEIDFKSEDHSGDITVDSERSLSLDYMELAKPKH